MNIEEVKIILKLVRKKVPLSLKVIWVYWLIGLLVIILIPIIGLDKLSIIPRVIFVFVFGSSSILMWVGNAIIKTYIETGHFELTNNELFIIQNENIESYKLSEIEILRITLSSEQGEPIGRVGISQGINNYLCIKKDSQVFKFIFLVENLVQIKFLRRKVAFLKDKGFNITISP